MLCPVSIIHDSNGAHACMQHSLTVECAAAAAIPCGSWNGPDSGYPDQWADTDHSPFRPDVDGEQMPAVAVASFQMQKGVSWGQCAGGRWGGGEWKVTWRKGIAAWEGVGVEEVTKYKAFEQGSSLFLHAWLCCLRHALLIVPALYSCNRMFSLLFLHVYNCGWNQ